MAHGQHPIQQAKGQGRNDKQIHRDDAIRMIHSDAATWLNDRPFEETKTSTEAVATFPAYVDSARWRAFKTYYAATGNNAMLRELAQREQEGREFHFESEWPPDYQPPKN